MTLANIFIDRAERQGTTMPEPLNVELEKLFKNKSSDEQINLMENLRVAAQLALDEYDQR